MQPRFWRLVKSFRFHSLFWRIFAVLLVLVIVPVTAGAVLSFLRVDAVAREETSANYVRALDGARSILDTLEREIEIFIYSVATDLNTERFTAMERTPRFPDFQTIRVLQELQTTIGRRKPPYVDTVYVYAERPGYVLQEQEGRDFDRFIDRHWFDHLQTLTFERGAEVRLRSGVGPIAPYPIGPVLSFFLPLPVLYQGGSTLDGAVVANINPATVSRIVEASGQRHAELVIATTAEGTVILHPESERIGTTLGQDTIEGAEVLAATPTYKSSRLYLVPPAEPTARRPGALPIATSLVVSIVFAVLFAFFVAERLYSPIEGIIAVIDEARASDPDADGAPSADEYAYITANILRTFEETAHLHEEARRQIALLREARAAALQSQINPHFLSNSLQTISWMAMELADGENRVSDALIGLDKLVRLSTATDSHLHSLAEEIAHAEQYVRIQRLRFGDLLRVRWSWSKGVSGAQVVKVCIQPLIENAIDHGIKPSGRPGVVSVSAFRRSDRLVVCVTDTGVGMHAESLASLNRTLAVEYTRTGHHIGLRNVNQRVKLIFGRGFGASVASVPGRYFTARLELPLSVDAI